MCKVLCLNHIVSYYPYGEMLAPSFHKDFYLRREVVLVKHFGNICEIKGSAVPMVDVVTGGSPC